MNRKINILLLSAFSSLVLSQQASANRPATEEANTNVQASVENMMQQETQQTGDVIVLPPKEMQAGETIQINLLDLPRRGMSMDKVQNELGQPISTSASVGQPPITSWTYSDRIVYFEYSTVLHVVAR
jgi:outer membrane protein assembly factor BamE (lipoprotein component of BamABCDE complex)